MIYFEQILRCGDDGRINYHCHKNAAKQIKSRWHKQKHYSSCDWGQLGVCWLAQMILAGPALCLGIGWLAVSQTRLAGTGVPERTSLFLIHQQAGPGMFSCHGWRHGKLILTHAFQVPACIAFVNIIKQAI